MDIACSFTFAFKDPQWTHRVVTGTAIMLIPIFSIAATGYQVEIARRVMRGESRPLPTWDNAGRKWTEGIVLFSASLIYYLPLYIIMCGPLALAAPALLLFDEQKLKAALGIALLTESLVCSAGILFAFMMGFLAPAIYLQYVRHGTFASCFNLSAIGSTIRRHPGEYLLAWLGTLCAGLIYLGVIMVGGLFSLVPFVGAVAQLLLIGAGAFWSELVMGHLVGQLGALEQPA
jgi:hypothetical protein